MRLNLLTALLLVLLSGCANPPFNLDGVNQTVQPQQTLTNKNLDQRVLWGGLIVATRNFKNSSQIEILSYPLDSDGEPIRQADAQGRFLLKQAGFVEPAEYAAGRWISAIGQVQASEIGQIGEADYEYPVLQGQKSHLWPEIQESDSRTRFHIGIGISL